MQLHPSPLSLSHTHSLTGYTHLSNDECYTDSRNNEELIPDKDGDLLLTANLVDVIDAGAGRIGTATGLRECDHVGVVEVQPISDVIDTTAIKLRMGGREREGGEREREDKIMHA